MDHHHVALYIAGVTLPSTVAHDHSSSVHPRGVYGTGLILEDRFALDFSGYNRRLVNLVVVRAAGQNEALFPGVEGLVAFDEFMIVIKDHWIDCNIVVIVNVNWQRKGRRIRGTFLLATWHGIQVVVKMFGEEVMTNEDKVSAFIDELALLQKIRHPNVVQFLGAVTQSSPMMIVTEYLPKGDLRAYLNKKRPSQKMAIKFALDIARGMNYLHEHKPEAIIHRDLEPS
ncbi:integrin-linked protein kinase 1-like [Zingiber officinale]|uniref:integrin-linked protein kinase 1-like n=1 Tax=Zingiber officinale TaxID=94328 RepID=UPI001C4C2604|nr:integrin-linked protein kinase 1-like [Zingiber officinale]